MKLNFFRKFIMFSRLLRKLWRGTFGMPQKYPKRHFAVQTRLPLSNMRTALSMQKSICIFLVIIMFLPLLCAAKVIGTFGETYPIIEPDLLVYLQTKAEDLKLDKEQIKKQIKEHSLKPKPTFLPTTRNPQTFTVDPTFILNRDITAEGKLIAKAGTKINPIKEMHSFLEILVFIDATDARQIKFATTLKNPKIILVNGDVAKVTKELGKVYFDQNGALVKKFHLKYVPSVITADNDNYLLVVKEISMEDYE